MGVTGYRVVRDGVEIAVTTTNSFSNTGLIASTTYTYQVQAEDADHNLSALCTGVQGTTTTDVTPPTVPTNLNGTAISRTQVNLTWTASTDYVGVTGYKVFRGGVQIGTSATTSYSDLTCWGNTTYSYTVSAYDARSNNSAQSTAKVITTPSVTDIIMDNPAGTYVGAWTSGTSTTGKYGADYVFRSTAVAETGSATFTAPIDVNGWYTVYCWYTQGANRATNAPHVVTWTGTGGGTQTVNINQQAGGGAWVTLRTNTHMLQGSGNSVELHNGTGATGFIVVADAMRFLLTSTTDPIPPSVPTGLTGHVVGPRRVSLNWNPSTDNVAVTGYNLYKNGVWLTTSVDEICESGFLTPSTTYTFTVNAYDAAGNTSGLSAPFQITTPAYANIIIDNPAATFTGVWTTSTSGTDKYLTNYKYASTAVTEGKTAVWRPTIAYAGYYDTYIWYAQGSNRATNSKFTVYWDGGSQLVNWNQSINGGAWRLLLGNKHFAIGTAGYLKLGNGTGATGKIVVADGARFQQINGD